MDNARYGVRVNAVMPGLIDTPMAIEGIADAFGLDRDDLRAGRDRLVPLGRHQGTAWDVAHAALFLASDEAGFITGAVLPVDGGQAVGSADPPGHPGPAESVRSEAVEDQDRTGGTVGHGVRYTAQHPPRPLHPLVAYDDEVCAHFVGGRHHRIGRCSRCRVDDRLEPTLLSDEGKRLQQGLGRMGWIDVPASRGPAGPLFCGRRGRRYAASPRAAGQDLRPPRPLVGPSMTRLTRQRCSRTRLPSLPPSLVGSAVGPSTDQSFRD